MSKHQKTQQTDPETTEESGELPEEKELPVAEPEEAQPKTGEEPTKGDEPILDVKALENDLNAAKAEAEDFKRKWYSVTAEYENYRKRTASSRTQAYADGRSDVLVKLFPVADNLDRALKSCTEETTRKGIEMVIKSFEKLLADEKVTEINPLGQEFDPETSEAIMAVEDENAESGTVKEVYLKGYAREGKVLRFAQVVVVK